MSNSAPLTCQEFSLKMWLWLSGELPEEEQQYWKQHLQNCSHCQEALATAQTVQDHYASLPLYEVRDKLVHNLIRKSKTQKKLVWRRAAISRWFSMILIHRYLRPRLIVVGAVLATFLVVFFYHLASRQEASLTWEAAAFDQKASELQRSLTQYDQYVSVEEWGYEEVRFTERRFSSFDKQVEELNYRLATMADELERAEQ